MLAGITNPISNIIILANKQMLRLWICDFRHQLSNMKNQKTNFDKLRTFLTSYYEQFFFTIILFKNLLYWNLWGRFKRTRISMHKMNCTNTSRSDEAQSICVPCLIKYNLALDEMRVLMIELLLLCGYIKLHSRSFW